MDTLDLAVFFGALHRAGITDTRGLSVDVTGGNLTVRAYDVATTRAISTLLTDVRAAHGHEPGQIKRWHGALAIGDAGIVVRLILCNSARKDLAA